MIVEEDYAGYQTVGKRAKQQDAYAFFPAEDGSLILAVADGVGGHDAGEVASRSAIQSFLDGYLKTGSGPSPEHLLSALKAANEGVKSAGEALENESGRGIDLGTTLTVLHLCGHELRWVSVGDSPLYRFPASASPPKLERLNADHSMRFLLAAEVAAGRMDAEIAHHHPDRNTLISAISGNDISKVDLPETPTTLDPGDILISASDGILTLSEDELLEIVVECCGSPARELARKLVSATVAKNHPKQDNTTVAIIRVPSSPSAPDTRP